jgi:5-methylcytosine-specific restriction endonuclease McrA
MRPLNPRCLTPRVRNPQNTYDDFGERKAELARLGFATYDDFLKSPLWANVKAKHYSMPGNGSCFCCGSTARLHVHHIRYTDMHTAKNLKSLCAKCHDSVHEKTSKHPKRTNIRRATLNVRKFYSKSRIEAKSVPTVTVNSLKKVVQENKRLAAWLESQRAESEKAKRDRLASRPSRPAGKLQKQRDKNATRLRMR